MRIRKRFLSLYGAVTTPPSPSPPDLSGGDGGQQQPPSPRVQYQQQLHPNNHNQHDVGYDNNRSSSTHTTKIGLQPATWTSSNTKIFMDLESEREKELIKTDINITGCRKESILCAQANNHNLVMKGWLEGDSLVPTKKKRGSYGRRLNNDKHVAMSSKKNNKNEKKEGVIMEGSRCSRVNGRGWRCSQQTLVGYSLCEHHLGKGRVRSVTTVRAQTAALKEQQIKERKDKEVLEYSPLMDHDEVEDEDEDEDDDYYDDEDEEFKDWEVESVSSMEGSKVFSKKTKLGVVKARSLSSLLSQISS